MNGDRREATLQRGDHLGGIVERERRLSDVRKRLRIAHLQLLDVADRLDQLHTAIDLPHRSLDLRMALVADHHDFAPGGAHLGHFDVNLGDQRARGVEHAQPTRGGFRLHSLGDSVGREDDDAARRHLIQLVDEDRALRAQLVDDITVVHDLVPHVDGRAVGCDRPLDDLDRAIDASAETARLGQQHIHS
jgi:hypothetical protein